MTAVGVGQSGSEHNAGRLRIGKDFKMMFLTLQKRQTNGKLNFPGSTSKELGSPVNQV